MEVPVRIGELATVPASAPARLVTVGLGSCVGVAMIDLRGGHVALAHVFLPEPPPSGPREGAGVGTYASTAVPALVESLHAAASADRSRPRLVAVIAGGARMFGSRPGQDVGERNLAAVRAALQKAGVEVVAEDVGGATGRTLRVDGGREPRVQVRVVGGVERRIWGAESRAMVGERRAA